MRLTEGHVPLLSTSVAVDGCTNCGSLAVSWLSNHHRKFSRVESPVVVPGLASLLLLPVWEGGTYVGTRGGNDSIHFRTLCLEEDFNVLLVEDYADIPW